LDQPTRDIWFNPYRAPKTERAWALNVRAGRAQALDIIAAWHHRDIVIVGTVDSRLGAALTSVSQLLPD
jgi:hypothetical protein